MKIPKDDDMDFGEIIDCTFLQYCAYYIYIMINKDVPLDYHKHWYDEKNLKEWRIKILG